MLSYANRLSYLQPAVDALDVVVMETGQHPQLLPVGVVTETDLTPVNPSDTEQTLSQNATGHNRHD